MMLAAVICVCGLSAGLLLIRLVPICAAALTDPATSISVIIPARNEERNLPRLLESLSHLSTPPMEILVVDDGSTDSTATVAARSGARVVVPGGKPAGWTGKSWACFQGAQNAKGSLFLFLDADTYFLPGGFEKLAARWSREHDHRLVISLLPYHAMNAAYEQLSIFFHILMAAGAGGFGGISQPRLFGQSLLIAKDTYFAAGGHEAVRDVVLENLRWASKLRECGARILCLGGRGTLQMRMFPDGFHQMSESWAKAFLQGAADSGGMVLVAAIAWISALWSAALLLVMHGNYSRMSVAIVYFLFSLQLARTARLLGNYGLITCLLYPLPLAYYCFIFGRAAVRRALGRKTLWRGREV